MKLARAGKLIASCQICLAKVAGLFIVLAKEASLLLSSQSVGQRILCILSRGAPGALRSQIRDLRERESFNETAAAEAENEAPSLFHFLPPTEVASRGRAASGSGATSQRRCLFLAAFAFFLERSLRSSSFYLFFSDPLLATQLASLVDHS